jgi:hypothetical protein
MFAGYRFFIVAGTLAVFVPGILPEGARADENEREVALGLAPHLLLSTSDSCTRNMDVIACQGGMLFAGLDLSAHWWPGELFAIGMRVSGSKDLDTAEGRSSDGVTWDPEDQWLWRLAAEAKLDPPILPRGIWMGAEVGAALLREVREDMTVGSEVAEDTATRVAPLFGLGLGWDLWLGKSFTLTPELRFQIIWFGEPPELRPGVEARDYGTSSWLEFALRLAYVF